MSQVAGVTSSYSAQIATGGAGTNIATSLSTARMTGGSIEGAALTAQKSQSTTAACRLHVDVVRPALRTSSTAGITDAALAELVRRIAADAEPQSGTNKSTVKAVYVRVEFNETSV